MNLTNKQKFKEYLEKQKLVLLAKINKENNTIRTGRDKSQLPDLDKILKSIDRQLIILGRTK